MRKTVTLLIALFALCVSSWATVTQQQIGSFYYELDDETHTATLIKDPNAADEWLSYSVSGDLTIPGTVNYGNADYTVTTIGEKAFINGNMSSIVIEEGVVNIAKNAFLFCSNHLTKATLPSTIESIGNYAFQSSGLTKITINATTPPTLGYDVFENASSLAHIYVPSANVNAYKAAEGWSDYASLIGVAPVSVEWNQAKVASVYVYMSSGYADPQSQTIDDAIIVTANAPESGDYSQFSTYVDDVYHTSNTSISLENGGTMTFAPTSGKLKSIVIECGYKDPSLSVAGSGWDWIPSGEYSGQLKWTSASEEGASSVVLACSGASFYFGSISSVEFIFVAEEQPAPATITTTVTWDQTDVASLSLAPSDIDDVATSKKIDGITASLTRTSAGQYYYCQINGNRNLWITNSCGYLTFTSTVGDISHIVITCEDNYSYHSISDLSSDWTYDSEALTLTWDGTASDEVSLLANMDVMVSSIEFTVESEAAPVVPDPTPALASLTWKPENGLTSINLLEYTNYAFGGDPESTQDETSATIGGVTATISAINDGQYAQFNTSPGYGGTHFSLENGATLTFSAASGQFERIVIYFESGQTVSNLTDWTSNYNVDPNTVTWSGTPANSVVLTNVSAFEIDSIVFTIAGAASADPTPAGPNFTWQTQQINHVSLYTSSVDETQTTPVIKNIITSITRTGANDNCQFRDGQIDMHNNGTMTFQSIVGDITGIVINCNVLYNNSATNLPADWTYNSLAGTLTWNGTAAETVTLSGTLDLTLSSIQFFYTPVYAPYLGDEFYGYNNHKFKVTGPKTVSMPSQYLGGTLMIPSTVEYMGDTYYVTEIEDYAFSGQVSAANVMSYGNDGGKHLAKIGAHAFDGCIRMDEVSLNSTVLDTIGDAAFKNCKLMTIFELWTEEPPVLGTDAFYGDTYLNHINVETYSVDAYQAATGWSAYVGMISAMYALPSVGEQFFFHNQTTTGIYQVTYASNTRKEAKVLPYNAEVNAIYPTTFEGTLVIPEEADYIHNSYSVTGIGANAYKDSTRFNMVLLPLGVKTIESGAFLNCTGVEKVFFLWDDPTTVTWADAHVGAEFKTAASHGTQIFVPQGRLAAYQAWAPAWADCMFEGELFDMTASTDPNNNLRHYCTFYDSTTDYLLPPSVWANVGVVSGGEFRIWPIKFDGEILPRGTAVVLESETPTYRLIPTGNTEPPYTGPNDLIGTDVTIPRTSVGNNGENVYVLGKQAQMNEQLYMGMGLYRYTGANLGAHKAYMILNTSPGQQNAPIRFLFKHEENATDVENLQDNTPCTKILRDGQLIIIRDGKEYNAQGQTIK